MGVPMDDGWMNQQVEQRSIYIPAIRQAHELEQPKGTKLILDLVEFLGPGTVLTMLALGAWVMGKKMLGKWFGEEKR